MGSMSLFHWLVLLLVIFIVFGAGKLPKVMGDVGKGIRNLRDGLKDEPSEKKEEK
jgi:sec-independent protein translocase protein TatA